MKIKSSTQIHAAMGDNRLQCMNCGAEYSFADREPFQFWEWTAICEGFDKEHKRCRSNQEAVAKRFEFGNIGEWLKSWDTGTSSRTIGSVLGRCHVKQPGTPKDADDFGRCYRLVKKFCWDDRIGEVSEHYPEWQPIVDAWPELCELYEICLADGNGTALNDRLKELT